MNEQYFFVRKLGLGKEVVTLSLVVVRRYLGQVE